jgi:hypothetical protein
MRKEAPSTSDQVIDSRDVIERIEELEGEKEALSDAVVTAQENWDAKHEAITDARSEARENDDDTQEEALNDAVERASDALDDAKESLDDANAALKEWTDGDEGQELKALLALQDEAEGYSGDWKYGATLIREDHFIAYAQDLADDIGAIDKNVKWPMNHIDWDAAAEELKQDYTEVDFDGTTYLVQ